jgi:hypothetical protein
VYGVLVEFFQVYDKMAFLCFLKVCIKITKIKKISFAEPKGLSTLAGMTMRIYSGFLLIRKCKCNFMSGQNAIMFCKVDDFYYNSKKQVSNSSWNKTKMLIPHPKQLNFTH